MVWEGTDAIVAARNTMGGTKCAEAAAGTIRGDFGLEIGRNLVHGSDKVETGMKEIALWFTDEELVSWGRDVDRWVFEG
jgi:nucleoside-diphosphate kinase